MKIEVGPFKGFDLDSVTTRPLAFLLSNTRLEPRCERAISLELQTRFFLRKSRLSKGKGVRHES